MKAGPQTIEASRPPDVAEPGRPARMAPRWPARLRKLGFRALILALVALNLVRLRDAWPPADPSDIARMLERNRLDDAEQALRDRLRRAPFEGETRWSLARILLRRGDMAASAAQFRLVPPWWPSKPEALYTEGQTAMAAGLAVEAEAAWRACLADNPLHPAPPRIFSASAGELVRLLTLEGRPNDAIDALWSISEGSSEADRPSILRSVMDIRLQFGKFPTDPASLATLQRFAESDPGDISARLALSRAFRSLKKPDEALRWVDSAMAASPDDLDARSERLAILDARGDRAGFRADVARLTSKADVDANGELWEHRGVALESSGDPKGAAECYRRALALRPADEALLDRLAKVADKLGDGEEARSSRQHAQAVRDARLAIPEAYREYLDASAGAERGGGPVANRISSLEARLVGLASTLGWTREASAWKRAGARPAEP